MDNLKTKTTSELLALHVGVNEELRERKILRSANNPTGDLAEYLFCSAFGWRQEANAAKSFDATDESGVRYQIKARRIHDRNKSRQMSAIRDLEGFDFLAAILFDHAFRLKRAALIPAAVVREHSSYIAHTNSHKFLLRDKIWLAAGVKDITNSLRTIWL